MKKPDVALAPGFAGEPALHPMSQTKRIRIQRIRLVAGDFAATEPIVLRVLLCGLHVHQANKAQVIVLSGVGHRLADSGLDVRRRERFAFGPGDRGCSEGASPRISHGETTYPYFVASPLHFGPAPPL